MLGWTDSTEELKISAQRTNSLHLLYSYVWDQICSAIQYGDFIFLQRECMGRNRERKGEGGAGEEWEGGREMGDVASVKEEKRRRNPAHEK